MKTSNNKKAYMSPEATKYNMNVSAHILVGSDMGGTYSITNLGGMGGFGGGMSPVSAD